MKKAAASFFTAVTLCLLMLTVPALICAQEHPINKNTTPPPANGGFSEAPNPASARDVSADEIRAGIRAHIDEKLKKNKNLFPMKDEDTKAELKLEFIRVHEDKVTMIKAKSDYDSNTFFACTDFKDPATGKKYDLDFWMKLQPSGKLKVTKVRVHKVDDQPRFTYEEDRILELYTPAPENK